MINAPAIAKPRNLVAIAAHCLAADCAEAIAVAIRAATGRAIVVAEAAMLDVVLVDCSAADRAAQIAATRVGIKPATVVAEAAMLDVVLVDCSAADRAARVAATRAAINRAIVVANPAAHPRAPMAPADCSAEWVLEAQVAADVTLVVPRARHSVSETEAMVAINVAVHLAIAVADPWVPTAPAMVGADPDRESVNKQV